MAFDPEAFAAEFAAPKKKAAPAFDPVAFASENKAPDISGPDAGPGARRAAAGLPPGPKPVTDAEAGVDTGPLVNVTPGFPQPLTPNVVPVEQVEANRRQATREMGAVLPILAAPAVGAPLRAAAGALPAVAQLPAAMVAGAVEGGASGLGVEGGSKTGAAVGAALPLAGAAFSKLIQGAIDRVAKRPYLEYGRAASGAGKTKTQAKIEALGPEAVNDVVSRYQLGSVNDPNTAKAAFQAAELKSGQQIGQAVDAIDAAPIRTKLGDAMLALKAARDDFARKSTTRPLADAMDRYMETFKATYGDTTGSPLTVKALRGEVTDLEKVGFGGKGVELSPAASAKLARATARALNGVIDTHLEAAAADNPAVRAAVDNLRGLDRDYKVIKTLRPVVVNRAVAESFAPSAAERFASDPKRSLGDIAARVATAPMRAALATGRGIDTMIARLSMARAAGTVNPALIEEARAAGLAPGLIAQLTARPAEAR